MLDAHYAEAIATELLRWGRPASSATWATPASASRPSRPASTPLETNSTRSSPWQPNWYQLYLASGRKERRLMNEAISERLYVLDDDTVHDGYAKPFAVLLGEQLGRAATRRYFRSAGGVEIDATSAGLSAKWAVELAETAGLTPEQEVPRILARVAVPA